MINVLDGTGGYDGKVSPRYLQRVVNRIVKYITDVTATPADSRPYKVYTAILNQSGTNAPTASILENTLGVVPVWNYDGIGEYIIEYAGAFPWEKVFAFVAPKTRGFYTFNEANSPDSLSLTVRDAAQVSQNDRINDARVEIRVYN